MHPLLFIIFLHIWGSFPGFLILFHWSRSMYWLLGQLYICLIIVCHNTPWHLIMKITLYNITDQKFRSVPSHQFWSDLFQSEKKTSRGKIQLRMIFLNFWLLMLQNIYQAGFPILVLNVYSPLFSSICPFLQYFWKAYQLCPPHIRSKILYFKVGFHFLRDSF